MSQQRPPEHKKAQRENRENFPRCAICGTTDNVQSHHLFDYAVNGTAVPDNFVTLCDYHHKKVHSGEISLIKIL